LLTFVLGIALLAAGVGLGVRDRSERHTALDQALTSKARDESSQLEEYFARARTINLITAQNPSFRTFYAGGGTRVSRVKARGPAIRQAENALAYLERLYPTSIGEACFIDRGGAENARYVMGRKAPFADLSPDESGNPFFAPTFALPAGHVYQARPYVSPDTHEWVISNSTPVPGTGYPAVAIVHFEVTVDSFRRAAAEVAGEADLAIVDARTGRVIVDSRSAQRRGRPLGRPDDRRFVQLATLDKVAGAFTVGGHRAAFRRLRQTEGNANDWYVVAIERDGAGALHELGWAPPGMAASAFALLLFAGMSFGSGRRTQREKERATAAAAGRADEERRYFETQHEFTEVMQITRDENEAYELLKLHLERSLPGSDVLVLNRNNSHDRLEPMTELPPGSPIAERLKGAEPDSCLAVRLGKAHERGPGHEPLLACELCCDLPTSTCVPSLVGGEVIGAVLVRHAEPLDATSRRRVDASITQASPVLANLRNLALSQTRALTDQLTGLPNRRSIDDTLKRMAAFAGRSGTPLAAVLFDLDHFKKVNDQYGHEKGDEVLAAVGVAVAATVRASDFVGRFGGEEFILLLPDTDRARALVIAEKVRTTVAGVEVVGVSRPITVSVGVAAIPDDAPEPTLLLRAADRALYLAKAQGRNRVGTLVSSDGEPLTLA
jgi:diguanylate cyclase (GGDEF)-like protein